ncbi:hypothetical protein CLAFUW4_01371 [Fulvia fulva]|uniref:Uncharacterized protein n=1 Tax=Passalora fulva TaxID=5499 RepID=A0A9Q8P3E9_PASFU|nr:uncharacterized protein CLAFUR5_01374 [Fulvia fulva]KAK4634664.1 hypothetical protein CLAFUR4_01372 [Fulvia fulva]KAK4637062.1 hypothetical protein CLAFUR0_01373 [Fulvia fulva]UJO11729.1 hypothetical protein CLAFUR5_01374 [Fulvia fulva]WPV09042.1 hypothetical protein CLAFUW4_01371 [Fulvia fulva]WPV24311.1 hypothetical protein CLAFUW7_01376 [Fulvia fulva]
MKTSMVLLFGYAAAAVVPRVNDVPSPVPVARPGAIIEAQEPTGTATASWISHSNMTSTATSSVTTAAPTSLPGVPEGGCVPASICVDKATMMDCGSGLVRKRYGGCYDKNFCHATTSYLDPTCG